MRKEFEIAYEKAEIILNKIKYNAEEMVRTSAIIDAVEKELNVDVKFSDYDFSKFTSRNHNGIDFESYGAAMAVSNKDEPKVATILINDKETPEMKRFSLVHELGHLMMQDSVNEQEYQVSTHIDMDITSIPDSILDKEENKFLIEEQAANIFALLVLIPHDMLTEVIKRKDSFEEVAQHFGVEKNALFSRIAILTDVQKGESNGE